MNDSREETNDNTNEPPEREYEQSGLHPKDGKGFHLWGLLGFLAGIIALIAVSAIVLDRLLI
jgi:hypothetical protein